jgi:hypothetical protein
MEMIEMATPSNPWQTAELGTLLSGLARAVVSAQDELDTHTEEATERYVEAPDGSLVLPPLAYAVKNATIEVEMAATIRDANMVCRLLDPASVALFGYQASSGMRIRLAIAPSPVLAQLKAASADEADHG